MIICAAIKIQIEGLDHETIIPCRRHGDGFKLIKDFGLKPRVGYKEIEQGFITNFGEFLNRKDAYAHALKCGQISISVKAYKDEHEEDELYSEDLY